MLTEKFRPKEILQQQDNQTCLSCCLLMHYSALFPDRAIDYAETERELHSSSFGLYPKYYALTHTAAFVRKFPEVSVSIFVDNDDFAKYLRTINKEERINIQPQTVSLEWVRGVLTDKPLILYTDALYLQGGTVHMPHFVYAFSDHQGVMKIADPAFGRLREIPDKELEDGIIGLKYQMLWSPIALSVQKYV